MKAMKIEPKFKIGDKIKFKPPETHACKHVFGHPFAGVWQYAEIGAVFTEKDHPEYGRYGVFAEYGQDYIGWEDAKSLES